MWSDTESSESDSPPSSKHKEDKDAGEKSTRSLQNPCKKQAAMLSAAGECSSSPSKTDKSSTEPSTGDQQEDKQVQGFLSIKDLEQYAEGLQLRRVTLRDLNNQRDLETGYVGGWVLAQHAYPYSQGHNVDVFIRDESTSDVNENAKHLMVTIDGKIVEEMPTLLSNEFMLFLHKARVEDENVAFSQDHHKRLVVEGPAPRVWIIHRHANKQGFFQQKTCKPKWFKRQKKIAVLKRGAETGGKSTENERLATTAKNTDPSRIVESERSVLC